MTDHPDIVERLSDEQIDLIERSCARRWMESNPPLGSGYCSPDAQRIFARAVIAASDESRAAEITRLRAEAEALRKALERAVWLYENYGLVAMPVPDQPMAAGKWINEARAAIAATKEQQA